MTSATARHHSPRPLPPRLIATDLDGTLLRDDKSVSRRTIAALAAAEQAGIEVFFVTGRPARWMNVVSDHVHGHGLAICGNGAAVVDLRAAYGDSGSSGASGSPGTPGAPGGSGTSGPSGDPTSGLSNADATGTDSNGTDSNGTDAAVGTVGANGTDGPDGAAHDRRTGGHRFVKIRPLDRTVAHAVVDILRLAAPGTSFAVELTGGLHHEPTYPPFHLEPAESVAPAEKLLASPADGTEQPVLKVLAYHPALDPDDFLALARRAVADRATVTRSSPSALLEISGPGVSKASTLALCCAERGISPAEVVAFGDMPNDVEMLSWAGTSYAMGNAHPAVIAAASARTAANNDDGVAAVIEQILLHR